MEGLTGLGVSIHASRAGGDSMHSPTRLGGAGFNPRLTRGRRLTCVSGDQAEAVFQSTPHAREATQAISKHLHLAEFQSTPHAREATGRARSRLPESLFQSTPHAREATPGGYLRSHCSRFQSTPHAREATDYFGDFLHAYRVSIHASRAGGDQS
mgnify:CR=1 FL=1